MAEPEPARSGTLDTSIDDSDDGQRPAAAVDCRAAVARPEGRCRRRLHPVVDHPRGGAPLIAPQDPLAQNLLTATVPPAGFADAEPGSWLGTDGLGRDVLSRVIFGTRVSLTVAFVAAGLACLIGSLLGLFAGFLGGLVDTLISRLVDIWMAFPPVLLSILLVAILGTGLAFGDRRHRRHRLDALLPGGSHRDHGTGADGLRRRGPHHRLLEPARSCSGKFFPTSSRC